MKKSLISAALSVAMLASSFTGLTAFAEKSTAGALPADLPEGWVKVYGEDFEGYTLSEKFQAEGTDVVVADGNGDDVTTDWKWWGTGDDWSKGAVKNNETNSYIYRIGTGGRKTGFTFNGVENLPDEHRIAFDLGGISNDANQATASFARINMSADGKSYYEIGIMGSESAISKHTISMSGSDGTPYTVKHTDLDGTEKEYNYPVKYHKTTTVTNTETGDVVSSVKEPNDTWGYKFSATNHELTDTAVNNEDGTTTTTTYSVSTCGDYKGATYFAVVKNGVTTYVDWGKGDNQKGGYQGIWLHVTVDVTKDGIRYEIMPEDAYFGDAEKKAFLSGTCGDASLIGMGTQFMFAGHGHEGGTRVDNFAIYSAPIPKYKTWTDPMDDADRMSSGATGNIGNWSVVESAVGNNTGFIEISDNILKAYNTASDQLRVRANSYVAQNLPAENKISFGLSQYGNYENNASWYLHDTVMARFAISEDGKSYYEIGKTGSSIGTLPLEKEGTDGEPSDENASGTDYTYRRYFRKVENGTTVYIKWDVSRSSDWFDRWYHGGLTKTPSLYDRYGTVTVQTLADGVKWSYTENGNEFAGTLTDSKPLARAGAPIEFLKMKAQNQGYAVRNFSITYNADDLPTPPTVTEDFSKYTDTTAITQNYVTETKTDGTEVKQGWKLTDGEKTIAKGSDSDGHKWEYVTSAKWTGSYASGISGNAYIDTSAQNLKVRGQGGWSCGSVNIDFGEDAVKSFEGVSAKMVSFSRMGMLNILVSADEKNFLTFGLQSDLTGMGINVDNRLPVVALRSNDAWTILAKAVQADDGTWSYECADGVTAKIKTTWSNTDIWNATQNSVWKVTVEDDGSISFKVTRTNGESVSGTIAASIVEPLKSAMRYPVALMSAGDGWGTFDDLSIWYTANENIDEPQISDNFKDYDATNAVTAKYGLGGAKKILAKGSNDAGHTWKYVTSKKYRGTYDNVNYGDAYIDTAKKMLMVRGQAASQAAVNVDLGNGAVKSVKKVSARIAQKQRAGAMGLFVNNAEDTFLAFGTRNEATWDSLLPVNNCLPVVIQMVGGTKTILAKPVITDGAASYECADGVTAVIGKEWKNNATPTEWTVEVNDDGSLSYMAKGDNGGVVTGTISASVAQKFMSGYRYPVSFLGDGDGAAAGIKSFKMWYEKNEDYVEPVFHDDFSFYTEDENTITNKDTETGIVSETSSGNTEQEYVGHRLASGAAVLGTEVASGAQWITSDVFTGSYESGGKHHPGQAYIDVSSGVLKLKGCAFPHIATVNLDFGKDKTVDVDKVTFTMNKPSRNAGIRLFVSGNEKYWVSFGFTGGEESLYGKDKDTGALNAPGTPIMRKSVAGETSLLYPYTAFAAETAENGNSTVTTDGVWSGSDDYITYTITVNEDGTIAWDAKGSRSGHSSGVIDDEDVKAIVKANWIYPVALASGGDGLTSYKDVAIYGETGKASFEYEKKAYTEAEFKEMYYEADYGRDEQVRALLNLDLSDVVNATAEADVTVTNTVNPAYSVLTGTHYEFTDSYDKFYNEDGTLRSDYLEWAQSQSPISSIRLGGASSGKVNMWKDLNGEDSTYISFPESKRYEEDGTDNVGKLATKAYKMGVAKTIKAFQANNPKISVTLAVSPTTTTAEEVGKLVKAFTAEDTESKGLRRTWFGSTDPINLYAIELGNEIDYGKGMAKHADIITWYLDIAEEMIAEIRANDATGKVKIIACGPTAPWGTDEDWGCFTSAKKWVTQLVEGVTDSNGTHEGIMGADKANLLSFHAYYYGINVEGNLNNYAKPLYQILVDHDLANVKLSMTEHAVFWHEQTAYYSSPRNSGLFAGLANAYFLVKAANGGFTDSGYNHSAIGSSPMYSRWQYSNKDKKFHANPETDAYNVISDAWGDEGVYVTNIEIADDVIDAYQNAKSSERFEATTVKVSDDTVNLILVNNMGYTAVDANIALTPELESYKLTKKVTYTAPNMFSFMFDTETADLAKVTETEYDEPAVFGSRVYTVPNKSMVVLTLSGNASTKLKDEFSYSNTDDVATGAAPDYTPAQIAANSNGTKWMTSGWNTDGTAKIDGRKLLVTNMNNGQYPMGANWDISGYKEVPENVNKVTFTTTNDDGVTGGVMLFVKTDAENYTEGSAFDFSNALCELDGTIEWTVTIAGDKLTWKAVSGSTEKTGTMDITEADMTGYDYFAQVYVNCGDNLGSVAISEIEVSYGAEGGEDTPVVPGKLVDYEVTADGVKVTVNPSADKAIKVMVGYFVGAKLEKAVEVGSYAAGAASDSKTVAAPTSTQKAQIFVWGGTSGMEPVQGSIEVKTAE